MYAGRKVGMMSSALLAAVLASNPAAASPAACSMRSSLDLQTPYWQSLEVADQQQIKTPPDTDDEEAVMIAAAPWVLEEKSDAQPSLGGVASLYWAARHATQAWRVFLPVRPDGHHSGSEKSESAAENAAPQAFAEQRNTGPSSAPATLDYTTGD